MGRVIYVVDVGSPSEGLAWARLDDQPAAIPNGGEDFSMVATRICGDLRAGTPVALGFEAPGCIPVPLSAGMLAKARKGEVRNGVSRPWSVGAGAYVTTMAIHLGAWLLREIKGQLGATPLPRLTLDPALWAQDGGLLLWEAFVSGPGHARAPNADGMSGHVQDAATAAAALRAWLSTAPPRAQSAVSCDQPFSTFGAIALWAGWTADLGVLSQEPLVLWPDEALGANVVPVTPKKPAAEQPPTGVSTIPATGGNQRRAWIGDAVAEFRLECGDSHSFWKSHQAGGHLADFERLTVLLMAAPDRSRQCSLSFDDGQTWHELAVRSSSSTQISWKGHSASASSASRVATVVRT